MKVSVHERVMKRHKEFVENDVLEAFTGMMKYFRREIGLYIGVGVDSNGRLVEMVWRVEDDEILIFHAMTPPSKKTLKETGLI